jgi:hypothetical protein
MEIFNYTKEELEDALDLAKRNTIAALVEEGILDNNIAQEWTESHSIIIRKKSIFRDILSKFTNIQDMDKRFYFLVVKKVF